ncbi:PepSY domain-containing protein [Paenibacillus sp. CMAA1364]
MSKASVIAVKHLKGTVIKVDLDHDNARLVYEVEMTIAVGTAEVNVDGRTGKIVSVKKDLDQHKNNNRCDD